MNTNAVSISKDILSDFCRNVFIKLNMSKEDAKMSADVLVAADMRGIPSHGVGRLWRYVNGLQTGQMEPSTAPKTLMESPMSIVIDANGGMGAPASIGAMQKIIGKAKDSGAAFGCVRNSNHFGIAGYYAMMALEHDMLGIAMTNTAALGVPTFGRQVMFGTNPLAFAAPAKNEKAFVLDMSTTVVSRGKVEVYDREGKGLPLGWAVDKTGHSATNAEAILKDMFHRYGGGILPLGGEGEQFGGYKGYGLAVMVDILCSVLCGAPFGEDISDTEESSARVSHFFGAIKISAFRDAQDFRKDMDKMLMRLRSAPAAEGEEQVYFAGQKEFETEKNNLEKGVSVQRKTVESLLDIAEKLNVELPISRKAI